MDERTSLEHIVGLRLLSREIMTRVFAGLVNAGKEFQIRNWLRLLKVGAKMVHYKEQSIAVQQSITGSREVFVPFRPYYHKILKAGGVLSEVIGRPCVVRSEVCRQPPGL